MAGLLSLFSDAFPNNTRQYVVGNATDFELADAMVAAWGSFVHQGTPGKGWPLWSEKRKEMVFLGNASSGAVYQQTAYRTEQCAVIDKFIT